LVVLSSFNSDISCLVDDKLEERGLDEPSRVDSLAGKVSGVSLAAFDSLAVHFQGDQSACGHVHQGVLNLGDSLGVLALANQHTIDHLICHNHYQIFFETTLHHTSNASHSESVRSLWHY